ncbi:MAG TPA: ABC transporter substrate-binding protein [Kribbella sp.]|jgi:peptide/nickel transport system substrate-binding protein
MMRSIRAVRIAVVLAIAALAVSACTFAGGSTTATKDQVVISMQFPPKSNWALETDDAFILSQVGCLETLVRYNDRSGQLEPGLATKWTQTQPTAWDFTLRDGVKFQNGTELTAQNVSSALTTVLRAETPARAFKPSVVTSVKALDAHTVRVTSPEPSPLIPFRLASVNTGILAPQAYKKSGIDPIGTCTGPFTATQYTSGQSLKLKRNDAYWGTKAVLSGAEAQFVPEGATRATQVQTGEADIAMAVPAASQADLSNNKDVVVSRAVAPRTTGLYFNTSKAPFSNPAVRRAVQLALNLDQIASQVYDGSAKPAGGPFAPGEPWAPDTKPVAQQTEQAIALLKGAGIAPGQISIELLGYVERSEFADLATVVQASLAKIGIKVKVRIADYAALEPSLLDGSFDLALLSRNHLVDIADPSGFLSSDYTCKGSFNISHYCDAETDALIASAAGQPEAKARNAIYAKVAQRLQEQAATVFLVHEQTTAAVRSNVKNFVDDPLSRFAITPDLSLAG